MQHNGLHKRASIEGYYSKFRLPDGASIALIISSVPAAAPKDKTQLDRRRQSKPYMISFTYVSPDSTSHWQREYWPIELDMRNTETQKSDLKSRYGFVMSWDYGEFAWTSPSTSNGNVDHVQWRIVTEDVTFEAETFISSSGPLAGSSRTPWRPHDPESTPAGFLSSAPLPIQWHVHSVDSPFKYKLHIKIPDEHSSISAIKEEGEGYVHVEKNWGVSFPKSYIWIQARDHARQKGINVSGGSLISGVQAFLAGYQGEHLVQDEDKQRFISFKPPTASILFGLSLGATSEIDCADGRVMLDLKGWFRRLRVIAQCPKDKDTTFTFAAPLLTGHKEDYCTQSFAATIDVQVMERDWPWTSWRVIESGTFERGSLEFGGGYYKPHLS